MDFLVPAAAGAAAAATAAEARLRDSPTAAKTDSWRRTFAAPQSGQSGSSPFRTSSSKCDSQAMHTYS